MIIISATFLLMWAWLLTEYRTANKIKFKATNIHEQIQKQFMLHRNYQFIKAMIERSTSPEHFDTIERLIDDRLRKFEAHAMAFELANMIQVKKAELIGQIYEVTE